MKMYLNDFKELTMAELLSVNGGYTVTTNGYSTSGGAGSYPSAGGTGSYLIAGGAGSYSAYSATNAPQPQVPYDISDYHCDINAWNSSIEGGRNPQAPGGVNWNGNELNVGQISELYNLAETPQLGTGGYGFYDSPNDTDDIPDHMYRYEYSGGDNVDVWNSDGIEPVTHNVIPLNSNLIENSDFASLSPLSPNLPIQ